MELPTEANRDGVDGRTSVARQLWKRFSVGVGFIAFRIEARSIWGLKYRVLIHTIQQALSSPPLHVSLPLQSSLHLAEPDTQSNGPYRLPALAGQEDVGLDNESLPWSPRQITPPGPSSAPVNTQTLVTLLHAHPARPTAASRWHKSFVAPPNRICLNPAQALRTWRWLLQIALIDSEGFPCIRGKALCPQGQPGPAYLSSPV